MRVGWTVSDKTSILAGMVTLSLEEAASERADLTRRVEAGETVVLTREGRPIADLVPHRPRGGVDLEADEAYLRENGIMRQPGFIAPDFDDPLPEDFLTRPHPCA